MEFILLVGLVFGIIVYRKRADGRRVDIGLMARRLFEFGFLFGFLLASAGSRTAFSARHFHRHGILLVVGRAYLPVD